MNKNQGQNQSQKNNEEVEEIETELKENIAYHQLGKPTVGKEHKWIQKGPDIICTSCESPHGIRIGVHKRLIGFDKNNKMIIANV